MAEHSGVIDLVWPPGSGIYFVDSTLTKEDGLYYGYAAYFPVDNTQCFLILGYSYDLTVYDNAIVELALIEPLLIEGGVDPAGSAYEIWESMADCQSAHVL